MDLSPAPLVTAASDVPAKAACDNTIEEVEARCRARPQPA